jgi:hypothetical protein
MDAMIARQRGNVPANTAGALSEQPLQIDYEILSQMVADKLRNEYDPV